MLILSWNVAGLSSTVHRIHSNYGQNNNDNAESPLDSVNDQAAMDTQIAHEIITIDDDDDDDDPTYRHDRKRQRRHTASQQSPPQQHALSYFFQRHLADIICIQEHKLPLSQLQNRHEPFHCASLHCNKNSHDITTTTPTCCYESFWSCCTDPHARGMNGVVTYVKCHAEATTTNQWKTTVISANGVTCFPHDTELNSLGRCVITEHGPPSSSSSTDAPGFILFNVYVPCGSNTDASLQRKMTFLRALRQCMQQQRQQRQKPIILAGDLNISYQKYDIPDMQRIVYIDELIQEVQQQQPSSSHGAPPQWKLDICRHWSTIQQILESTKQAIPTTTTNSITGDKYCKFRCRVTIPLPHNNKERHVFLGSHESNANECLGPYTFTERTYFDQHTQTTMVFQAENTPSVQILLELMNKLIFPVHSKMTAWDDATVQEICDTVGTVNRDSPSRKWLQSLLEEDRMIDTFRYYYPTALGRFTCWNQSLNCRYRNEGSRIDYTIIDESLLSYLEKGNVPTLRCGTLENTAGNSNDSTKERSIQQDQITFAMSQEGAMSAITANGRFQPAPFDGNGIIEADRITLDTQFGDEQPHTGHVYTPPTFSDHIGVSLLLNDSVVTSIPIHQVRSPLSLLWNDAVTRKSQPHKQQPRISTFFQNHTLKAKAPSSPLQQQQQQHKSNGKNSKSNHSLAKSPLKNGRTDQARHKVSLFSRAATATKPPTSTKPILLPPPPPPTTTTTTKRVPRPAPPLNSVWYHFSIQPKAKK